VLPLPLPLVLLLVLAAPQQLAVLLLGLLHLL
jgi:hypothetical protein